MAFTMPLPLSRFDLPSKLESWRSASNELASGFARIAVAAGAVVMHVYEAGAIVRSKADNSPVCDADEKAEAVILAELGRFLPGVPVLAEEAAARGDKPYLDGRFILVDPVDGTKEFLSRNGEFTVNIALVDGGVPTAGAVYAPALEKLWFAGDTAFACSVAPGGQLEDCATIQPIASRAAGENGFTVMASRSHADEATETFLRALPVGERQSAGSSLKFCAVAEGLADVYPRFGPTMEWDTAAGDAVLRAAGGIVLSETGAAFRYGKSETQYRNGGFVAWGSPGDAARWMPAIV